MLTRPPKRELSDRIRSATTRTVALVVFGAAAVAVNAAMTGAAIPTTPLGWATALLVFGVAIAIEEGLFYLFRRWAERSLEPSELTRLIPRRAERGTERVRRVQRKNP